MKFGLRICLLALLFLAPQSWAEETEATEEDTGPWSGKVALGYIEISGNTDSTSLLFQSELNWDRDRWHHTLIANALGRSEDDETTAEAYRAGYKGKFDITDRNYAFGLVDYFKNRFSGYDHQLFEIVGLGRRFIKTERHELNAEAGVGATQSKLAEPEFPGDDRSQDEVNYRLAADYTWTISDNATFSQNLSSTSGSSNTYVESLTELSAKIAGNFSMVLGYIVKHNSDVPADRDKTDTLTSISLEYEF